MAKHEEIGWIPFLVALAVVFVPLLLWYAFVLQKLWLWFLVPIGAPAVSMAQAYGASVVVAYVTHSHTSDRTRLELLAYIIAAGTTKPALYLAFGAVLNALWIGS